ncbi:hypothetical protein K438DRAFT_1828190 [Mycena galopus ATCC 62051]|nr:hypothetical protein K438DRAFT_1828190 [Mycena galopus ATCC 62051]
MSFSSPQDSSNIITASSVASYVELAALVIPQRKLGLKDKLRRACAFLPMPLSLGWDADPEEEEAPPDSTVPGLLLSDMGSGATRFVTARWMHSLYKNTVETQKPGTFVVHLREAGYTTKIGWAHAVILVTFLLQFSIILVAMMYGQHREGWLLLAGGLIRIGEGIFAWAYPKYRDPRTRNSPRYCALHTGMTTNHVVVLTHRFSYHGKCVNLEDAAAPIEKKASGWKRKIKDGFHATLRVAVWLQKGASLLTSPNGYTIPVVLLLGTCVLELVSVFADALPAMAVTVLATDGSVLDRLTAACQFTQSISVGFVENLLPDPRGDHVDYKWISAAMLPDTVFDPHPDHPAADDVRTSTLLRRRRSKALPAVLPPTYPPMAMTGTRRLDAFDRNPTQLMADEGWESALRRRTLQIPSFMLNARSA